MATTILIIIRLIIALIIITLMEQLIAFDKGVSEDGWRLHAQHLRPTLSVQVNYVSPLAIVFVFLQNYTAGHTLRASHASMMANWVYRWPAMHQFGAKLYFCVMRWISVDKVFVPSSFFVTGKTREKVVPSFFSVCPIFLLMKEFAEVINRGNIWPTELSQKSISGHACR